jgi:hypothetical protein
VDVADVVLLDHGHRVGVLRLACRKVSTSSRSDSTILTPGIFAICGPWLRRRLGMIAVTSAEYLEVSSPISRTASGSSPQTTSRRATGARAGISGRRRTTAARAAICRAASDAAGSATFERNRRTSHESSDTPRIVSAWRQAGRTRRVWPTRQGPGRPKGQVVPWTHHFGGVPR